MRRIVLLTLLLTLSTLSFGQTLSKMSKSLNGVTKEQADSLYKQENYEQAAAIYESIIAEKGPAYELYYNLGNCYYKLSNISQSILNYERALLLNPADTDIRENLALARGKTVDKVTPPSEMFFVTWWRNLAHSMTVSSWSISAIIAFILTLVGILVYLFVNKLLIRKIGIYGAIALFAFSITANLAAYSQHKQMETRNMAIVIAPVVSVKSSPNAGSTDLFIIHEGSKVEILDTSIKGWREIKLEEGKIGWIQTDTMDVI